MRSQLLLGVNQLLVTKLVRKTTNPTNLLFVVVKNNVIALRFNEWTVVQITGGGSAMGRSLKKGPFVDDHLNKKG